MSTKHLNLDIFNDTSENIPLRYDIERNNPFLEEGSNYRVATTRFKIPSQLITPFKNSSTLHDTGELDYRIGIYNRSFGSQDVDIYNTVKLKNPSETKNDSTADFIANMNNSLYESWWDHHYDSAALDSTVCQYNTTGDITHTFTPGAMSKTFNITSIYTAPTHILGVRVILKKWSTTSSPDSFRNMTLNIVSPSGGTKCCLFSGEYFTIDNDIDTVIFEDWAVENSLTALANNTSYVRKPMTPFLQIFKDFSPESNPTIELKANSYNGASPTLDMRIEIQILTQQNTNTDVQIYQPIFPPYFSADENDNLTFHYSEAFGLNMVCLLSKNLSNRLGMPTREITLLSTVHDYIDIEQTILTTASIVLENNLKLTHHNKEKKTVSATDLYKIVIKTTLPIDNQIDGTSLRDSSRILVDFLIDNWDNDFYEYTVNGGVHRWYDIVSSNQNIDKFEIEFYIERKDGTQELIYIPPQERANLVLMFENWSRKK